MATGIVDLLKTGRAKLQTHKCYDFLEVARPDFDLVAVEKILDNGIENFIKTYSTASFKCIEITYHEKTGNVKSLTYIETED